MDNNFIGLKIQLYPTEEQIQEFKKNFGIARYVYNYGISEVKRNYEESGKFLGKYDLNNQFTEFKNREENSWLLEYDATTMKIVLFDVAEAYRRFSKKLSKYPKMKRKKDVYQQYPIRPERMSIYEDHIRIPGIKTNIACGHIPNDYCIGKGYQPKDHDDHRSYYDARIIFDGYRYYLSVKMRIDENINISSYDKYNEENSHKPLDGIIGIDFGFGKDNWIVDSNGNRVRLPDTSKENKKIKHLNRKLHRQIRTSKSKKRSKNREKTIAQINKYYKRSSNKRKSAIHDYVLHEIIERKPLGVVIEDIETKDFLMIDENIPEKVRNKYNSNIIDHSLYEFQNILGYKCKANDIPVIKADDQFPSTKRCSGCGNILDIGRSKVYRCPKCGLVINRDDNAAKNLASYPSLKYLEEQNSKSNPS